MAYLIPKDYSVTIQDVNIQQIIQSDETIRDKAQLAGESEAKSYLVQKYDISREFRDLAPFAIGNIYNVYDRCYLFADIYDTLTPYVIGDLTQFNSFVYICLANTTGAFNPSNWALVGKLYDIFTPKLPFPAFRYDAYYNIGDQVYWKDATYTCRIQTPVLDHDTALQYRTIQNLPYPNVPPDDNINGIQYWGSPTPYSVTGVSPTDATKWQKTDPRDQQLVLYICDVVLYHLHSRIAPRNIPELRVKRYEAAIDWFKMCAVGDVTPNLPLIQPKQGNRIRYGGNIRQINTY